MYAEHTPIDDGGKGKKVEDLASGFPDGGIAVLLHAFFVEAVDLGDLARLVVAADEGDAVGVTIKGKGVSGVSYQQLWRYGDRACRGGDLSILL